MTLAPFLFALSAFDACEKEFEEARDPSEAYMCFYFAAQSTKRWEEGEERVSRLIERLPERRHWLELVRGNIQSERDEGAAEASYAAAAEGFAASAVAAGEVLARNNLTRILQRQRRHAEAERQIELVLDVAERSGDPTLIARARISEADYLTANGREVARAYRALKRAEEVVFPDGSPGLKRRCLDALGQVSFAMGRLDESVEAYQRLLALLREQNDDVTAAMITYNIADARYRKLEYLPDARGREEVLELAEEALKLAVSTENRRAEAFARQLLVELLPRTPENADVIRSHAEKCVAVARELGHPDQIVSCTSALGGYLADVDREEAESVMAEAVRLALESGSSWYIAYAWRNRARLSWKTKDYEAASADAQATLEAVESLRRLQDEERGRVELFSEWTQDYYTFSGRLLQASELSRGVLGDGAHARPRSSGFAERVRDASRASRRPGARSSARRDSPGTAAPPRPGPLGRRAHARARRASPVGARGGGAPREGRSPWFGGARIRFARASASRSPGEPGPGLVSDRPLGRRAW